MVTAVKVVGDCNILLIPTNMARTIQKVLKIIIITKASEIVLSVEIQQVSVKH